MSSVTIDVDQAWAFGPDPSARTPRGWRPFGMAAGVVAGLGIAAIVGFVAFVSLMGQDDAARPAIQADVVTQAAVAPAAEPPTITDVRLTNAVDAVTGEPAAALSSFSMDDQVNLWLSIESVDATGGLTAVWFRGNSKVARLTAPVPDAASQMVFPLPQVAVDRPGLYRVEVRSHGDVLATESFEVING